MPFEPIDPRDIHVLPLAERKSYIDIRTQALYPSRTELAGDLSERIDRLAERIRRARARGASVMLTYGAHLIKNGLGPTVIALLEGGWVTHVATQGAGVIHDWEFAFQGVSSESVGDNAPAGRFGAWDETGRCLNLAVVAGAAEGLGFGESVGRFIATDGVDLPQPETLAAQIRANPADPLTAARADLLATMTRFALPGGRVGVKHPFKEYSVPAAAYRKRVPFTVHPGIGYDIIVNHPMYHGAAIGRASGTDVRIFDRSVLDLEGGVYLSVGSAIMSPQVFEKAVSCANNLRGGRGQPLLRDFDIAVVDLQDGGKWDWAQGEPPKDHPGYYLRFMKSFHRMGGRVDYLCCDNRAFLRNLAARL